jgi:hypothetical protein
MLYADLRRRYAMPVFAAVEPAAQTACGGQRASAAQATTTTTHPAVYPGTTTADRRCWDASGNGSRLHRTNCTEAT